jgi:hypothetical protein
MFSENASTTPTAQDALGTLHFAKRGELLSEDALLSISGFEAERMRARALLTVEQEKKLSVASIGILCRYVHSCF